VKVRQASRMRATQSGSLFSWSGAALVARESASGYARVRLAVDRPLPSPAAGQYVLIRSADGPALPRAFSPICVEEGEIDLLIKVSGVLREGLARWPIGSRLEVRGPYGAPYADRISLDRAYLLVGGGCGVAPLLAFARAHRGLVAGAVLGFRPTGVERLVPEFPLVIEEVSGVTATAEARRVWQEGQGLIACGPEDMLRAIAVDHAGRPDVYVSLETRIGCGIGACLACSVPTPQGNRRVCRDGPLFALEELPWLI